MKQQITLQKQLKDSVFRKWFATPPPREANIANSHSPPWYVYVQKVEGGPWARTEVESYVTGYQYIAKNLKKYHDFALSHKRRAFQPPVVKRGKRREHHQPDAPGHGWCPYCRRMVLYRYFAKHHSLPPWAVRGDHKRCSICGADKDFAAKEMRRFIKQRQRELKRRNG